MGQRVKLRLNQEETDSVKIGRGVRQRCCMSPILFNLYGEYLMKKALAEVGDFKIGGRIINKFRLVDTRRKFIYKHSCLFLALCHYININNFPF